MFRFFIKEDLGKYDLSSLKYAVTAGEALNPEVFNRFMEATGIRLMEGFGQTETTLVIANLVGSGIRLGSMGKPNPLYEVKVLDPDGKEPDAGVYLRGAPQVQIWDIRRTNVGAQVGSGGLYNNKQNPSTPTSVQDNKLGEWNTFRILMKGDKVTVWLNGTKVVDNVVLENYWDRSQPIFPCDQIEMQAHGSRCYFRNIYVREIKTP